MNQENTKRKKTLEAKGLVKIIIGKVVIDKFIRDVKILEEGSSSKVYIKDIDGRYFPKTYWDLSMQKIYGPKSRVQVSYIKKIF